MDIRDRRKGSGEGIYLNYVSRFENHGPSNENIDLAFKKVNGRKHSVAIKETQC